MIELYARAAQEEYVPAPRKVINPWYVIAPGGDSRTLVAFYDPPNNSASRPIRPTFTPDMDYESRLRHARALAGALNRIYSRRTEDLSHATAPDQVEDRG